MTRATRRLLIPVLTALLHVVSAGLVSAAPPWLERLGDYRIVDASGRLAYKPAYAPSPLLRARPFYPSGYAGARYGRGATQNPTGFYAGEGRKACGHVGPCRHGR